MCVIMVANNGVRPTEDMVRLGFEANKFGAGASWQEDGQVKWAKGLDLEAIQDLNQKVPFPYVLHFRVPSSGTSTLPGVCHPFPIEGKVSLALKGATKTGVLFHNGFWTGWKDKMMDAAIKSRFRIPNGPFSDTRGLAWMTSHFGLGVLELIDEKVIVMTPKFIYTFGSGWSLEEGVLVSNTHWKTGPRSHHYHTSQPASWQGRHNQHGSNNGVSGGGPIVSSFPGSGQGGHAAGSERRAADGADNKEEVQQGTEEVGVPLGAKDAPVKVEGPATGSVSPTRREELSQLEWAKGLQASGSSHPASKRLLLCRTCQIKDATVWRHGLGRCYGCWERAQAVERAGQTPSDESQEGESEGGFFSTSAVAELTGNRAASAMCNLCNMEKTIRKVLLTKEWICYRCWINRQRPRLLAPGKGSEPLLAHESGQIH